MFCLHGKISIDENSIDDGGSSSWSICFGDYDIPSTNSSQRFSSPSGSAVFFIFYTATSTSKSDNNKFIRVTVTFPYKVPLNLKHIWKYNSTNSQTFLDCYCPPRCCASEGFVACDLANLRPLVWTRERGRWKTLFRHPWYFCCMNYYYQNITKSYTYIL